jgi:AcrR family transcriptional regulator
VGSLAHDGLPGASKADGLPGVSKADGEARQRLLEAAAPLFAERGFRRVTIREICRASGSNVAAVNYYFRNKLGLYTEVIGLAIDVLRSTTEAAIQAGSGGTPEQKLRAYVRVYVERAVGNWDGSWIHKLMSRELGDPDPSPALDLVVEKAIRPRLVYLSGVVGELLGPGASEAEIMRCVASVHAQWFAYAPGKLRSRVMPHWRPEPAQIDALAHHVEEFSLAGIRAVAQGRPKKRRR